LSQLSTRFTSTACPMLECIQSDTIDYYNRKASHSYSYIGTVAPTCIMPAKSSSAAPFSLEIFPWGRYTLDSCQILQTTSKQSKIKLQTTQSIVVYQKGNELLKQSMPTLWNYRQQSVLLYEKNPIELLKRLIGANNLIHHNGRSCLAGSEFLMPSSQSEPQEEQCWTLQPRKWYSATTKQLQLPYPDNNGHYQSLYTTQYDQV